MAPTVERSCSSQEALLQLEKGTGNPVTQLEEAARIIGLDLSLCATHPEVNREVPVRENPAPKEEWVLRWLLKKLKAGNAYRVEPGSFLLFRQLIDRIPLKTLATTLSDYKFLLVLGDVFSDLENGILSTASEVLSDSLQSGSESSHTLSGSPTREDSDKKGKKRKRASGYEDAMDLDEPQPTHSSYLLAFMRTLDTLYCLVNLTNKTQSTDDIATAHLKHALREQPEPLAKILGRSFKMGAVATEEYSKANLNTSLRHLFYVLSAALDLWELRSSRLDDADNNSSNDCFSNYCFPQALRFQLAIRSSLIDCDERTQILHGIERLIALHVVLPARASFFAKGGSGIDYSSGEPDWSPVQPVTDAFRPYLREKGLSKGKASSQTTQGAALEQKETVKTSSWSTAQLFPTFLDIAIRSVPRDTFRRQTHEVPWLETLFVAIAELTFSTVKEDNGPDVISTFLPILEQLFRVVLERKVQLSLHTLLTHAAYTGLLKDDPKLVDWDLTALLMKLGVDIFLPNSGLEDSSRLLNALVENVTSYWTGGVSLDEGTYSVIKAGVVIPLLRGFASARALPTFVQLWHEQLVAVESARSKSGSSTGVSVWEDDDVATAYSDVLKISLTSAQAIFQLQAAIADIKTDNGRAAETPNAYARFVVIEAGLKNIFQTESSAERDNALRALIETVTSTLSSKQALHWRWRLWRFATNMFGDSSRSAYISVSDSGSDLVEEASKIIIRLHKKSKRDGTDYIEILEAYRFILIISGQDLESRYATQLEEISENIPSFLKTISTDSHDTLVGVKWNGLVQTVNSPLSLATGYLVTLLRNPEVWQKLRSDIRRALFNEMFSLAATQRSTVPETSLDTPSSQARFLEVWAGLVSHAYLLNAPYLANDLVIVLSDRLKNDTSNRELIVNSLQRIPSLLISRHQRGILLDLLQDILLQGDSPLEICAEILSLMAKLAELPKSPATVTSDWEVLWKIAKVVSLQGTDVDLRLLKSFRSLHRAVISKFLVLAEEDRRKAFKKIYRKVSALASKLKSINYNSLSEFLVRISISQILENRTRIPDVLDDQDLSAHREKLFELLVSNLSSFRDHLAQGTQEDKISLTKVLDALEDFEDLARNNKTLKKSLADIEESVIENAVDSVSLRTLVRRRILAARNYKRDVLPLVQSAAVFPIQKLYGEEQKLFIHETVSRFRSMSAENLATAIRNIREAGFIDDDAPYRLLLVAVAVSSLPPVEEKTTAPSQELSSLCTAVTESLPESASIEQFSLACECLDVLLRNHPRSITQWNVDSMLASVSVCASSSGPDISPEHAGTVYTRLCRLMGILLGLYRQKLGGRFHLVVPVMQRLLNCLFPPNKKRMRSTRVKVLHSHPHWLAPLNASHAVHYTRLLTSLCDPTVSAVSRPTQSGPGYEALIDQTKKAKRVAGQYLQYVIMEYAECSLRGALKPEVKAAVIPGLYAALDVMSRDTMRALNAGLDVSGRAVFKGLYDDYLKFGKWNKG